MNEVQRIVRGDTGTEVHPVLPLRRDDGFFELDRTEAKSLGAKYAERYQNASPFPHIVLDSFVSPDILRTVVHEFPKPETGRFHDAFSQLKTDYTHEKIRSAYIHDLFSALNSAAFLNFLEKMTGIKGLISDARFVGGGLHETRRGGHLSIHADFNLHPIMKLRRRVNLILFLNESWDDSWGGKLELWDRSMKRCEISVSPVIGRAVIFNTDSDSYHGHPDPLEVPNGVTRRSIALYYYTAPDGFRIPHTTRWRRRPGSEDKVPLATHKVRHALHYFFGRREDE